jgi:hypothetical protein
MTSAFAIALLPQEISPALYQAYQGTELVVQRESSSRYDFGQRG